MADQKTDPSKNKIATWVADESGYEKTNSSWVIRQALDRLKKDRVFLTLFHKGYQSGNTILVNYSDHLQIDKPVDWPGVQVRIRVIFRDGARLWNHFSVQVLSVTNDTIVTEFPKELFQLQRRLHYRVDVPRGSQVLYTHKGKRCQGLYFQDISIGGILICMKVPLLEHGDTVSAIEMAIPGGQVLDESGAQMQQIITIGRGEVVRAFRNRQNMTCFGIEFRPTAQEEKSLFEYVRYRELELLRKGIPR